ncbi:MAG: hypothetical protein HYZ38_05090 [Mycobacterium sp.]|nr:hypothetical protein [Mycobacterium sp.]
MPDPYVVRTTPGIVELWSPVRLPFEPRGWLIDMRNDLRRALHSLSPTPNGHLHAVYGAANDGAFVDTENVLLYNVGGTALRPLGRNAVTFERRYQVPSPPVGDGLQNDQALHYHRYSEAGDAPTEFWRPGRQLGAFFDVPVNVLDKPAPVFKAIREYAAPPSDTASTPTQFYIDVQITDTRQSRSAGSVVSIIKPALDGIISAYHGHGGSDGSDEARRLELSEVGTADALRDHLLDGRWAALGTRRLVRPFGAAGVQWNPADEFCVFARISLSTGEAVADTDARWRLTAKLSEAKFDESKES